VLRVLVKANAVVTRLLEEKLAGLGVIACRPTTW